MKRFDFVVGYDISSAKRLRKMAKLLESRAVRMQYSLFIYHGVTKEEIESLVDEIVNVIDSEEDDVRIYRVDMKRSLSLGSGFDLKDAKIFL
jgi:CRISPR-associated protein Cas2